MSHRGRTALTVLAATAALSAACSVEVSPGSVPVPFSVAPVPSASASRPEYICTMAYKILTDGAVRLAQHASGADDALRQTFTDLAAQLNEQAAKATDGELRKALTAIAEELAAGARQSDPKAFLNGDFETIGRHLDAVCT